jgi:hypothetical protein
MIRTQIQLHPSQDRALRRLAGREGISFAEAVRRCIDKVMSEEGDVDLQAAYSRAASIIGAFSDKDAADDLSVNHDAYLDGAYE